MTKDKYSRGRYLQLEPLTLGASTPALKRYSSGSSEEDEVKKFTKSIIRQRLIDQFQSRKREEMLQKGQTSVIHPIDGPLRTQEESDGASILIPTKSELSVMSNLATELLSSKTCEADKIPHKEPNNHKRQKKYHWHDWEREQLLQCFKVHGRQWKKIQKKIPNKSCRQIRTYVDRYLLHENPSSPEEDVMNDRDLLEVASIISTLAQDPAGRATSEVNCWKALSTKTEANDAALLFDPEIEMEPISIHS